MSRRKRNSKGVDYVNNKELYDLLCDYLESIHIAEKEKRDIPQIPDKIALALMQIATRRSNSPLFFQYTYRDEMIADAIVTCVARIRNFNPEKSENPFSYFTQICNNAFWQRVKKENKLRYAKYKSIEMAMSEQESFRVTDVDNNGMKDQYCNEYSDSKMRDFIVEYERKEEERKEKRRKERTKSKNTLLTMTLFTMLE